MPITINATGTRITDPVLGALIAGGLGAAGRAAYDAAPAGSWVHLTGSTTQAQAEALRSSVLGLTGAQRLQSTDALLAAPLANTTTGSGAVTTDDALSRWPGGRAPVLVIVRAATAQTTARFRLRLSTAAWQTNESASAYPETVGAELTASNVAANEWVVFAAKRAPAVAAPDRNFFASFDTSGVVLVNGQANWIAGGYATTTLSSTANSFHRAYQVIVATPTW